MLWKRRPSIQAFTVHEKPDHQPERLDRAEELVFIKDGFSFAAFLLAPIWMLAKRAWIGVILYALVVAGIAALTNVFGLDPRWSLYAIIALHLIIGFEADSIERWVLDRRGWRQITAVTGVTFEDCERRFFEYWHRTVPAVATPDLTAPGRPGGLTPDAIQPKAPVHSGDLIPPKRTGWRSAFSGRGAT